ncbi:MAG: hypothetical protein ACD_15C00028G0002 [uncultured bacterium]|nr:MAG: hypothetical protein ACD_15C00028G0002 [uncultured bacterium]HCU70144.1 hypothetical protein [Candidatus Moranbacteria bacterium]
MKKMRLVVLATVFISIVSFKAVIAATDEWVIENVMDSIECGSGKITLVLKDTQCNSDLNIDCLSRANIQNLMAAFYVSTDSEGLIGKSFSAKDSHRSSVLDDIIQTIIEARGMAVRKSNEDCRALKSKG